MVGIERLYFEKEGFEDVVVEDNLENSALLVLEVYEAVFLNEGRRTLVSLFESLS